jgi:hypothetical protein
MSIGNLLDGKHLALIHSAKHAVKTTLGAVLARLLPVAFDLFQPADLTGLAGTNTSFDR